MPSLSSAIRAALLTADPTAKVMAARDAARAWRLGRLDFVFDCEMPEQPAWPEQPQLLAPNKMPKRKGGGSGARQTALWHSLAHIEFVAIDLALDMAGRFGEEMGEEFVSDFMSVAADEAMHFALLARKLKTMGSHYGALPAHAGLWQAAHETRHDVSARLAIVPMVLEARGLDVTPATLERIRSAGYENGVQILSRILDDEIRHVAIGTRHFVKNAQRMGKKPQIAWQNLVSEHFRGSLKPPFNVSARSAAGLSRDFYEIIAL
ncbi:MAG: ferritin-like domain-containing protein [Erythrobacter sp.]